MFKIELEHTELHLLMDLLSDEEIKLNEMADGCKGSQMKKIYIDYAQKAKALKKKLETELKQFT